jgi:hypothetical protein
MAQRYIYLSDELNNKLKSEENASGLIQNLLIDHYNDLKSEEQILKDVKEKIKAKEEERKNKKERDLKIKKRIKEMKKKSKHISFEDPNITRRQLNKDVVEKKSKQEDRSSQVLNA